MLTGDCSFMLLAGNAGNPLKLECAVSFRIKFIPNRTHKRGFVARTPIVLPVAYMSYDSVRALTLGLNSAKWNINLDSKLGCC